MGIESVIRRTCTQTAVHWGSPVDDQFGGVTFAAAREIACRWERKNVIISSPTGAQEISRTTVYVLEDLEEGDYLYLGTLSGLTTAQKANPKLVDNAFMIRRFNKIPDFKGVDFTRSCNLDEWNE